MLGKVTPAQICAQGPVFYFWPQFWWSILYLGVQKLIFGGRDFTVLPEQQYSRRKKADKYEEKTPF